MKKLTLSAMALSLAFAGAAFAGENANKPMAEKPATHGSAVSTVAQSPTQTTDTPGAAVSTMAHSNRDFKQLDADGNGSLSSTEIASDTTLSTQLTDWDDDSNQELSQAEYDAYIASTVTDDTPDEEEAE